MNRLDKELVRRGLVKTRSQAESYIKLGKVKVNGRMMTKSGLEITLDDDIALDVKQQYVSRAALKLASVSEALSLSFKNKVVLDVGSSTGGFTDYALRHGAKKVIAVDTGTDQLHPSLHGDERIELHEQTDIRGLSKPDVPIDMVLIDVSFISLRQVLPPVKALITAQAEVIAMVKPQFETAENRLKNRGVIKNERIRRDIFKDFEKWVHDLFRIMAKADSQVTGEKGNKERFYKLKPL